MPVRALHCLEDARDERRRQLLVIQIAQAVDEDSARRAPVKRLVEAILVQLQRNSALGEATVGDAKGGRALDVAMGATGADLGAAGHGVPRRVGPLNRAVVTHIDQQGLYPDSTSSTSPNPSTPAEPANPPGPGTIPRSAADASRATTIVARAFDRPRTSFQITT